jgi:tetratricopeptide (TPR) repeat protein
MIASDIDNLRGALHWSLEHRAVETALVLGGGIWRWWWQRGLLREGLGWVERALTQPHQPVEADARAMRAAGIFANGINDHAAAKRWFEASRNMAMHFEEVEAYAAATTNLGLVYRETGELDAASSYLAESIGLARTFEPVPPWLKFPLLILARVRERQGEWLEARVLFEEALRLNREVRDAEGTADALQGVAFCAGLSGEYEYARQCCDESLQIYTTLEHQYGMAWAHVAYGRLAHAQGRYAKALDHYKQSLTTWIDREDQVAGAEVFDYMADSLCCEERYADAVMFTSAAYTMRASVQAQLSPFEETARCRLLQICRAALDSAAYEAAWAFRPRMTIEQAIGHI